MCIYTHIKEYVYICVYIIILVYIIHSMCPFTHHPPHSHTYTHVYILRALMCIIRAHDTFPYVDYWGSSQQHYLNYNNTDNIFLLHILSCLFSLPSPPFTGKWKRWGSATQNDNWALCPSNFGQRGEWSKRSLGQWPAISGNLLPLAIRTHMGLVATEPYGKEANPELQEWSGMFLEQYLFPCPFITVAFLVWTDVYDVPWTLARKEVGGEGR